LLVSVLSLAGKIVFEVTYIVSSGKLNPIVPICIAVLQMR